MEDREYIDVQNALSELIQEIKELRQRIEKLEKAKV